MLTQARLKELLRYNKRTGLFTRLVSRGRSRAGSIAGTINLEGYVIICIDYQWYLGHRLAYFYVKGIWPENDLDHKNRKRADNRWCNLRDATRGQNNANGKIPSHNTSGVKGVHYDLLAKAWRATIMKGKKRIYSKRFPTKEAIRARFVAAQEIFGEFHRVA